MSSVDQVISLKKQLAAKEQIILEKEKQVEWRLLCTIISLVNSRPSNKSHTHLVATQYQHVASYNSCQWSTVCASGVDLDFCKGGQNRVMFLCVGEFTCSVQNTFQNVKHSLLGGSGRMPPRNFLKKACSEIESGTF